MVGWRMGCAPRVLLALLAVRAARGYDWCYADEPDACDGDPPAAPGRAPGPPPSFWQAAKDGNTARLQQLLDLGQGVNDRRDGVAALFWATYYTQPAAMRLLLGAGADPNMGDDLGFSPLHASVFDPDDCHECAQILVDANADLTYRKDGLTPLEYAKYREGRPRVVKVLEDAVAAASGGSGGGDGDGEADR